MALIHYHFYRFKLLKAVNKPNIFFISLILDGIFSLSLERKDFAIIYDRNDKFIETRQSNVSEKLSEIAEKKMKQ